MLTPLWSVLSTFYKNIENERAIFHHYEVSKDFLKQMIVAIFSISFNIKIFNLKHFKEIENICKHYLGKNDKEKLCYDLSCIKGCQSPLFIFAILYFINQYFFKKTDLWMNNWTENLNIILYQVINILLIRISFK